MITIKVLSKKGREYILDGLQDRIDKIVADVEAKKAYEEQLKLERKARKYVK